MNKKRTRQVAQQGFGVIEVMVIVAVLGVLGFIAWRVWGSQVMPQQKSQTDKSASTYGSTDGSKWTFTGTDWKAAGNPPACPDPLNLPSPVDLNKATAVLYPGQTRGGDYKPHGGFLFAGSQNDAITVTAPMDASVYKGSRYIEQGETQYFFVFINSCGIMYRFDHLLTLSPEFQKIADKLPAPKENDSSTTLLTPMPTVKKGDVVATAVGFRHNANVSVDFGVYDLRKKNAISQTAAWQQAHSNDIEFGAFGICWLDALTSSASAQAKALPGGDGVAGKQSDYCK